MATEVTPFLRPPGSTGAVRQYSQANTIRKRVGLPWLAPVLIVSAYQHGAQFSGCKRLLSLDSFYATYYLIGTTILCLLTTGPWLRFSEFYGRKRALIASLLGSMLVNIFIFVVSLLQLHQGPGSTALLVTGGIIGSLFGGFPTLIALTHSYLADSTPERDMLFTFCISEGIIWTFYLLGGLLDMVAFNLFPSQSPDWTAQLFGWLTLFTVLSLDWILLVLSEPGDDSLRTTHTSHTEHLRDAFSPTTSRLLYSPLTLFYTRTRDLVWDTRFPTLAISWFLLTLALPGNHAISPRPHIPAEALWNEEDVYLLNTFLLTGLPLLVEALTTLVAIPYLLYYLQHRRSLSLFHSAFIQTYTVKILIAWLVSTMAITALGTSTFTDGQSFFITSALSVIAYVLGWLPLVAFDAASTAAMMCFAWVYWRDISRGEDARSEISISTVFAGMAILRTAGSLIRTVYIELNYPEGWPPFTIYNVLGLLAAILLLSLPGSQWMWVPIVRLEENDELNGHESGRPVVRFDQTTGTSREV